jgi:hypothetical protein
VGKLVDTGANCALHHLDRKRMGNDPKAGIVGRVDHRPRDLR